MRRSPPPEVAPLCTLVLQWSLGCCHRSVLGSVDTTAAWLPVCIAERTGECIQQVWSLHYIARVGERQGAGLHCMSHCESAQSEVYCCRVLVVPLREAHLPGLDMGWKAT